MAQENRIGTGACPTTCVADPKSDVIFCQSRVATPTLSRLERDALEIVPCPIADEDGNGLFQQFDQFISMMSGDPLLHNFYDELADEWASDIENRNHYGGFFKNYFRNREQTLGYDEKVVWQSSSDFLENLELQLEFLGSYKSDIQRLISRTRSAFEVGVQLVQPVVQQLCFRHPELKERLMPSHREWPCTIRLMRYRSDPLMGTNPHVDKTSLSSILWTNDPIDRQCLAFPRRPEAADKLSQFAPVVWNNDVSGKGTAVFFGAALFEAGYPRYQPAIHAVLPIKKDGFRYSLAFFWLLSDLDLSGFSTKVTVDDDAGFLRESA